MDRARWTCLTTIGVFVGSYWIFPVNTHPDRGLFNNGFGLMCIVFGFACVWWSEVLGEALWIGRGAWNPKPSTGPAVAILGWLFLIGAFLTRLIFKV
jgi:hypothetical protein